LYNKNSFLWIFLSTNQYTIFFWEIKLLSLNNKYNIIIFYYSKILKLYAYIWLTIWVWNKLSMNSNWEPIIFVSFFCVSMSVGFIVAYYIIKYSYYRKVTKKINPFGYIKNFVNIICCLTIIYFEQNEEPYLFVFMSVKTSYGRI